MFVNGNYKLNRYSGQLLVLYFSSTQTSIATEKMVYIKLREAKYSSSIVLASNGPFPTKLKKNLWKSVLRVSGARYASTS